MVFAVKCVFLQSHEQLCFPSKEFGSFGTVQVTHIEHLPVERGVCTRGLAARAAVQESGRFGTILVFRSSSVPCSPVSS